MPSSKSLFTFVGSVTFLTSSMMAASWGGRSCPPSLQYTLYPLYSFGLCDAVMTTPAEHFKWRTAKDNCGVGRKSPKRYTLIPLAAKTSAARREKCLELFLES